MRHRIQGKRIVIEDASLVELVVAHDTIIDVVSEIHMSQLKEDCDILNKRKYAKRYAKCIAIKRDIELELHKRVKEKKWQ